MTRPFETRLAEGNSWEYCVSRYMRSAGWFVLPSCEFSGPDGSNAPKLLAPDGMDGLTMPDLLCVRGGTVRWLEVKFLSTPASYSKYHGRMNTVINTAHLENYLAVQQQSGIDVHVAFIHGHEQETKSASLQDVDKVFCHEYTPAGKTYFDYDALTPWPGAFEKLQNYRKEKQ